MPSFTYEFADVIAGNSEPKVGEEQTVSGSVDGCWHYDIALSEDGFDPFPAELWVKPELGVVKVTMVPGFNAVELAGVEFP